jgi:CHRD domain-containing protein
MGKLAFRGLVLTVAIGLVGLGSYAIAGSGTNSFKGDPMVGYAENNDVSTTGVGSFEAKLTDDGSLHYVLSYSGLEGNVLQAHVHFGKTALNGGISYFLCTNLNAATDDDCPQAGTVEGDIDAADVIGPTAQGIEVGNLAEIVAAMRAGHAYANVHTSKWPGGEIRAQINDKGESRD